MRVSGQDDSGARLTQSDDRQIVSRTRQLHADVEVAHMGNVPLVAHFGVHPTGNFVNPWGPCAAMDRRFTVLEASLADS